MKSVSKPVICNENGVFFSSIAEAARVAKCSYNTMQLHLAGNRKTAYGKTYRFANKAECKIAEKYPRWTKIDELKKYIDFLFTIN